MAAHGLDVDPRLVRAECPDPSSAAEATRNLLSASVAPTALLSAATRCSLGVVPTLHALGRTDVALVCFGDFAMADLLQPGVTVVDHSAEAVGAAAATRLAERIAQPDLPASTLHVPVRLIRAAQGSCDRDHARGGGGCRSGHHDVEGVVAHPDGERLALVEARTPWTTTPDGGTELDAERFVELTVELLRRAFEQARAVAPVRVSAIAVAGLAESGVLLDGAGSPGRPSLRGSTAVVIARSRR